VTASTRDVPRRRAACRTTVSSATVGPSGQPRPRIAGYAGGPRRTGTKSALDGSGDEAATVGRSQDLLLHGESGVARTASVASSSGWPRSPKAPASRGAWRSRRTRRATGAAARAREQTMRARRSRLHDTCIAGSDFRRARGGTPDASSNAPPVTHVSGVPSGLRRNLSAEPRGGQAGAWRSWRMRPARLDVASDRTSGTRRGRHRRRSRRASRQSRGRCRTASTSSCRPA